MTNSTTPGTLPSMPGSCRVSTDQAPHPARHIPGCGYGMQKNLNKTTHQPLVAVCLFVPVQQVVSALDGNVKLTYSGHRKVAYGIQMALMDNPLIQSVDFDYVD